MNDPMKVLMDEHEMITKVIEKARSLGDMYNTNPAGYKKTVNEMIHFFRTYADQFHHIKEEKLLFPLVAEENQIVGDSLVTELNEHHEEFRELIGEIENSVLNDDYTLAQKVLIQYTDKLLDHIAIENEEFFAMAEAILSPQDLEKMYFDFQDADRELGNELKSDLEKLATEISK